MRLFVAVHFSDEVKKALIKAQDTLTKQGRGNFTPPENLHLTLSFIGETDRVDAAEAALSSVRAEPVLLRPDKIGQFGDLYWIGIHPSEELLFLQKQVAGALNEKGFCLDEREFIPHVTICRRFEPFSSFDPAAAEAAIQNRSCIVDRISLMSSASVDGKRIYSVISEKMLI